MLTGTYGIFLDVPEDVGEAAARREERLGITDQRDTNAIRRAVRALVDGKEPEECKGLTVYLPVLQRPPVGPGELSDATLRITVLSLGQDTERRWAEVLVEPVKGGEG